MITQAEENYLKAIHTLEQLNSEIVSTTLISKQLKTKASSVTDMIKKLAEKKLVNYEKYKGVTLTNEGKLNAIKIVRRHRLWETFLVEKLNYNWDEVHVIAEQLEHIKSDTLINRLDGFLEFPKHDPHGDPIPDEHGNIDHHNKVMLSSILIGNSCIIVGVKDSSSSFLKYLDNSNIKLGSVIKTISKEDFDNSMLLEIDKKTISISHQISKNLFVKNV